jgi:hypothetical protein
MTNTDQLRCAECGRFLGDDCLQGVDWSRGSIGLDGDWPWTEDYYCAHGVGCNAVAPRVEVQR